MRSKYNLPNRELEFQEGHINMVWMELKTRFGFNIKAWKERFETYLKKQPRNVEELSAFWRFGNDYINPVLNEILARRNGHPTFNNLVDYVVKGRR